MTLIKKYYLVIMEPPQCSVICTLTQNLLFRKTNHIFLLFWGLGCLELLVVLSQLRTPDEILIG